jgi:hypothetical protein
MVTKMTQNYKRIYIALRGIVIPINVLVNVRFHYIPVRT